MPDARPLDRLVEEGAYDPASRTVRAIRGPDLHCANWQIEGILRMLFNVLDPEVGKDPKHLVVYGGFGRAARSWEAFETIVDTLLTLEPPETLVIQSGKPVAVFPTLPRAPRMVMCNSMLVGAWANWDHFWELEKRGLMMYGQYTAGSWNFIGIQGILQGTYETLAEVAAREADGSLAGRFVLTAGMGAMGGAQPLAIKMNRGAGLVVEVDRAVLERRQAEGWLDTWTDDLDVALDRVREAVGRREGRSVGLLGNAAEVEPLLVERGVVPDVVTDQTPAHDPSSYVPAGMTLEEASALRERDPKAYTREARRSMRTHVEALVALADRGAVAFEYGNNIRKEAQDAGFERAFAFPGFVEAYIRPMFEEGRGPFRWTSLRGEVDDIVRLDDLVLEMFPENDRLGRWIRTAREVVPWQGLPARVCWFGYGERAAFGTRINELVAAGEVGPIWVGRDHLDSGSVASPYRETEGMKDGSDAVGDWPILNALLNACTGATWVAVHQGGGQGMGYSISAGFGMVLDGSDAAGETAERLFTTDPGMGVVRHADAGYDTARRVARAGGIDAPSLR